MKSSNKLRLGFYHHIPICSKDGDLYVIGHMGRFLDGLASQCDQLIVFAHPADDKNALADYRLNKANISWVDMGPRMSAPYFTIFGHKYRRILEKHLNEMDAMLIRGPTPLLPALARINKKLPTALLLGGDYLAGMASSNQPFWRKTLLWLWSLNYNHAQLQVAKHCLTLVNSRRLYTQMKPNLSELVETRTTTLSSDDFFKRVDTCRQNPVRLLYTGRMDRAKGILDVLEAVRILVSEGEDIVFDLVGMPENGDSVLIDLQQKADLMGLGDRIHYHGYKPVGPELFEYYKQADIYILASQSSFEGFPRTIWEAMAHSLPVVATKVGSIPDFLTDGGVALLVPPNRPDQLAQAVSRLINNPDLRRKLIKNGHEIPKSNTIENRSKEQIAYISDYVNRISKNRTALNS